MRNPHNYSVDKRLSAARQLLSAIDNEHELSRVYVEGCIDASLLQVYFALLHYTNELAESYGRPTLEKECFSLKEIIVHESDFIAELLECKQLMREESSWISIVINHPSAMLNQEISTNNVANDAKKNELTIISSDEDDEVLPLTVKTATWAIDQCYQLIQRQREHLTEC